MRYWLGIGSNLGDRLASLRALVRWLEREGIAVEAVSGVYETAPRDRTDQPAFLNAALRVRSELAPPDLLAVAKRGEAELGRRPGARYGPRVIDCDLLLWEGGGWAEGALEIPHPRLAERLFVLAPLAELDPPRLASDGPSVAALAAAIDPAEQVVARVGGPETLM